MNVKDSDIRGISDGSEIYPLDFANWITFIAYISALTQTRSRHLF